MAKTLRISSRAQNDIEEILASVIEYTGFESSGIRLQEDIYQKFETIAYALCGWTFKRRWHKRSIH